MKWLIDEDTGVVSKYYGKTPDGPVLSALKHTGGPRAKYSKEAASRVRRHNIRRALSNPVDNSIGLVPKQFLSRVPIVGKFATLPEEIEQMKIDRRDAFVQFIWNMAVIALAIGCVMRLWDLQFDFSDFMTGLMQVDFGSFDFAGLTQNVNSWVEDLPSWLDWAGTGIRALAYGALSIGYVVGFVMKVIGYVFAA